MINVGIIGSAGRMGSTLIEHLENVPDMTAGACLEVHGSLEKFLAGKPDVVVDFSLGAAVAQHGSRIVTAGLPYIIGATNIGAPTLDELTRLADESRTPVLLVPNFSIGANLLIRFAGAAAKLMEAPVITERHHMAKADAPSGTARLTAERIRAARAGSGKERESASTASCFSEQLHGVMGGALQDVAIHSIRGAGFLAEQQVAFTLPGESLAIEHRSIDRRCFMPGVEYAIRNIGRVVGLQTGLDTILDI
jgi:4-hydroxy-tetrahydrodipicolinate reductase